MTITQARELRALANKAAKTADEIATLLDYDFSPHTKTANAAVLFFHEMAQLAIEELKR